MFNHDTLGKMMGLAYSLATDSPDPSSQNGALLVHRHTNGEMEVVSKGYNHFYDGIEPEVDNRDEKLRRIEHAERDAIYQAANRGIVVQGSIMVCPWAACADCARAIIGSGVSALVYHRQRYLLTDRRWVDQVNQALGWLESSGLHLFEFDGPVPNCRPILVSGRQWHPGTCNYIGD